MPDSPNSPQPNKPLSLSPEDQAFRDSLPPTHQKLFDAAYQLREAHKAHRQAKFNLLVKSLARHK
jgi:hypothetical protein